MANNGRDREREKRTSKDGREREEREKGISESSRVNEDGNPSGKEEKKREKRKR